MRINGYAWIQEPYAHTLEHFRSIDGELEVVASVETDAKGYLFIKLCLFIDGQEGFSAELNANHLEYGEFIRSQDSTRIKRLFGQVYLRAYKELNEIYWRTTYNKRLTKPVPVGTST